MPPYAFFHRRYPSANCVLLRGPRPVLVDTGFGSDTAELEAWLAQQGTPAATLSLIVNTHHHSDHVGGNHRLQSAYGIPIAAARPEAMLVNRRDPDACRARWLHQPVEPYGVVRMLADGDAIATGDVAWRVVALPGHTLGQIGLHAPELDVIVLGDALHADDVGWLDPFRESPDVLEHALTSVARIAALAPARGLSGHGVPIEDVAGACAAATARLRRWRGTPQALYWHACKRVFAHALIVADGMTEPEIATELATAPWFADYAVGGFGLSPAEFVPLLVAEMLRAGAARWRDGRLRATADYAAPMPGWRTAPGMPADWPHLPPEQFGATRVPAGQRRRAMVKAVIFDVDGTLVDSVDQHAQAWQDAFQDFGHAISFERIRAQIGKGGDQLLPVFLDEAEVAAKGKALEAHRGDILKSRYLPNILPFPEVRSLFERLRAAGVRIVLASSAKQEELAVYKKIAGIEDLLDAETSSDDAEKSKPHPDIFEAAKERLGGVAAREIVVIGDTPYDAEAAGKAGLRTVGVLCGGFAEADLLNAGCVAIYRDPADLLAQLDASPLMAAA